MEIMPLLRLADAVITGRSITPAEAMKLLIPA